MPLIDSQGNPISLGTQIGKGGEGHVFEVEGEPRLAAKIYHQIPLSESQYCKLDAMVRRRNDDLSSVAAWPSSLLRDAHSHEPCGLLMPRVDKSHQLHELYGTTNRRLHFPEVRWHHLLLAARNVAAAFHTLHQQGIVVGDVNQGNLLVNHQYRIRFIDCDSFQITEGENIFYCPVGTPHFTPPELQSQRLSEVTRTFDHDRFGLAVLIFHLIFVGRHPFAGRFRGEDDLLIEEAIAERRFAFSRDKEATLVDPPPYSMQLDDLPAELGDLFEIAFRTGGVEGTLRPTPEQWVQQIDAVMQNRKACDLDELHIYYAGLRACPWCRIEDEGGPAFFVQDTGASFVSDARLQMLDAKINALRPIKFPDLIPSQITPPESVVVKQTGERAKIGLPDVVAALLPLSAVLCVGGAASIWSWYAGAAMSLGAGTFLLTGKAPKARREKLMKYDTALSQLRNKLLQLSRTISLRHQKRKHDFDSNMDELRGTVKRYCSEGDQVKDVLREQACETKNEFLREHLLRDHIAEIPGLTSGMIPMLESYGVESALDVHKLGVYGVPVISPELALELLRWRETIEQQFKFKPDHGVTAADLQRAQQAAIQRFKISQARKILIGARHLESLAAVGNAAVKRSLKEFESLSSKWKEIARGRGEYQQSRTRIERVLNDSPAVIVPVMLGIPIICGLIALFFA